MRTTIKKIDFIVQAGLIIIIFIPALLSIFSFNYLLLFSFYLAPILAIWQLLSAISWGLIEKDKERGMYILASLSYLLMLWAGVAIMDYISIDWIASALAIMAFIPPIGLAIYYAWVSWRDAYDVEKRVASFWDF